MPLKHSGSVGSWGSARRSGLAEVRSCWGWSRLKTPGQVSKTVASHVCVDSGRGLGAQLSMRACRMATPYAGSSHTIDIARGNIPRVNIPRGSCQASKGDIQAVTVLPRLSWVGQAVMGHSPCNGVKKKQKPSSHVGRGVRSHCRRR